MLYLTAACWCVLHLLRSPVLLCLLLSFLFKSARGTRRCIVTVVVIVQTSNYFRSSSIVRYWADHLIVNRHHFDPAVNGDLTVFMSLTCQGKINLCPKGAHTCARPFFCCRDLDNKPMTLKLDGGLDIQKKYLHTENCKVPMIYEIRMAIASEVKKYENSFQGQRSSHMSPTSSFI